MHACRLLTSAFPSWLDGMLCISGDEEELLLVISVLTRSFPSVLRFIHHSPLLLGGAKMTFLSLTRVCI